MKLPDGRILLDGRPAELAPEPLKSGGQAAVYAVPGQRGLVVKVYRDDPTPEQERRLARMMELAPLGGRPTHDGQPPELAWPVALGRTPDGRFVGYAMRRFGEPDHVQLLGLFNRQSRLRLFHDRADWRFLLGVSFNLAFMTARMHHQGLVVGDFSSNNVVVDRDGFITFLDCDSIGFTDPGTGEEFPCLMLTPEYCAPERQQGGPATQESDDFALAILIYQLLTAGNHPFGGVRHDSDSDTSVKDNIAYSASYVVRPEVVTVPRGIIDPAVLPPRLLELARRAFGPGVEDPAARPKAAEWLEALDAEWEQVRVCADRPHHTYGSHLRSCPWCARPGQDLFNAIVAVGRPVPVPTVGPVPFTPPSPPPLAARGQRSRTSTVLTSVLLSVFALCVLLIVLSIILNA